MPEADADPRSAPGPSIDLKSSHHRDIDPCQSTMKRVYQYACSSSRPCRALRSCKLCNLTAIPCSVLPWSHSDVQMLPRHGIGGLGIHAAGLHSHLLATFIPIAYPDPLLAQLVRGGHAPLVDRACQLPHLWRHRRWQTSGRRRRRLLRAFSRDALHVEPSASSVRPSPCLAATAWPASAQSASALAAAAEPAAS